MKSFKFLTNNEIVWRCADGTLIPIHSVHIGHIRNIMRCLVGLGNVEIPQNYQGRCRAEWYDIFLTELKRRRNT